MAKVDLRKLKDQATKATEKKQYAKAAELYLQIAEAEPGDADWRQRAGEAFRKLPDAARATEQLELAAESYARGGFLLKAIAVCKVVLQIDPKHTTTQATLAELYARREGRTPSGKVPMVASMDLARTPSGQFAMIAKPAAPPAPAPRFDAAPRFTPAAPGQPPAPAPPSLPLSMGRNAEPTLGLVDDAPVVTLDEVGRPAAAPSVVPLDALPLREVLGGRRSAQFPIVAAPPTAGAEPGAYEISLDEEVSLADAVADHAGAPPPRGPGSGDELDFSSLLDEGVPSPPPAPELPKIPLFSSLGADDLRQVIERVEVRSVDAGDVVVRQGEQGGSLFVVVHGRVQVLAGEGKSRRELAALGAGAFFGELALLTNFPRSATVVATEPTQLIEISRELTDEIVKRSPDVLKTLLRFFRDRLLDRLLGSSAMFSSFSPEEAQTLAERFVFLELEPRMRVIAEGERAPGMFVLLCGEARVRRGHKEVARLQPGDVFGEMSLLTRGPATATIETQTKCWALELPRERFQEIMLSYPQMLEYVSELAERRKQENLAGAEARVAFL